MFLVLDSKYWASHWQCVHNHNRVHRCSTLFVRLSVSVSKYSEHACVKLCEYTCVHAYESMYMHIHVYILTRLVGNDQFPQVLRLNTM